MPDPRVDLVLNEGNQVERLITILCFFIHVGQAIRSDERGHWLRVSDHAMDILRNVVEAKESPPSVRLNILEDKASAWVGLVAPNHTRWQDGAVLLDVANCHVFNVDQGLRQAWFQGVEHAAWRMVLRVRLFLLLGTDVDGPPDRVVYLDVVFIFIIIMFKIQDITHR